MALTTGLISNPLQVFIQNLNKTAQTDPNAAIKQFCDQLEQLVFEAIKNATLTLPSRQVVVQGANSGGPVVAANESPLTFQKILT